MLLLGLGAALTAAVLFGSASVVQATAVRRIPRSAGLNARLVGQLLRSPMFLAAMALNLIGFSLHLVALRSIPLFLAQAGIAASLAVTALLAVRVFGDELAASDWAAVAGTCGGLALLAASSGSVGDEKASPAFIFGLFAVLGALATGGLLVSRMQGFFSTELLGLLAGFGFAGVSVSARVLPGLAPATVLTAPSAYALALSGALAFLLYSVALQRGSVTGATAPMIVSQTVTPAAVGVLLLNDGIRPGWMPIAAIGFLVTGLGALKLARFERTVEQTADQTA
jgi:drug/metabolite transporter (DMT)-like permease